MIRRPTLPICPVIGLQRGEVICVTFPSPARKKRSGPPPTPETMRFCPRSKVTVRGLRHVGVVAAGQSSVPPRRVKVRPTEAVINGDRPAIRQIQRGIVDRDAASAVSLP